MYKTAVGGGGGGGGGLRVGMSQLCTHNFMNNSHLCESGIIYK